MTVQKAKLLEGFKIIISQLKNKVKELMLILKNAALNPDKDIGNKIEYLFEILSKISLVRKKLKEIRNRN